MLKKHFKRLGALIAALVLCVSLLPAMAFAAPTDYTITYHANDGSAPDIIFTESAPDDKEYTFSDDAKTALPTRPGLNFAGWATSPGGIELVPSYSFTPSENRDFYAVWYADGFIVGLNYRIEYDANGGKGAVPTDSTKYKSGTTVKVKSSPKPTRSGYFFDGWSITTKGDKIKSFIITSNTVLYARWVKPLKVEYDANGGKGSVPTDSKKYRPDTKVKVKTNPDPTRDGYDFAGWSLKPKGSKVNSFSISSNTVLYARWAKADNGTGDENGGDDGNDTGTGPGTGGSTTSNEGTGTTSSVDTGNAASGANAPDGTANPSGTTIGDEEVPLIQSPIQQNESILPGIELTLIIALVAAGLCAAAIVVFVKARKKRAKDEDDVS